VLIILIKYNILFVKSGEIMAKYKKYDQAQSLLLPVREKGDRHNNH
jgi:hypothetical protein